MYRSFCLFIRVDTMPVINASINEKKEERKRGREEASKKHILGERYALWMNACGQDETSLVPDRQARYFRACSRYGRHQSTALGYNKHHAFTGAVCSTHEIHEEDKTRRISMSHTKLCRHMQANSNYRQNHVRQTNGALYE
jgi:hypothetical protein